MTPSMGMAAPKGMAPAAPQAGLAAIAQPAQAPKGMSSGNMAQVMAMARKMSDGQLAEVLQGKSLDVPQYVAMTEAMGRKSLRTAMQGQQAMAQAQQPSIKQKLLMGDQPQMQGIQQGMPQMPQQPVMAAGGGLMYADGGPIDMNEGQASAAGGLAELPAPNMEGLTLASGGIVAFADTKPGTDTAMPIREDDDYSGPQISDVDKKIWEKIKGKFNEWNQPWGKTVNASPAEVRGAMNGKNLVPGARPSAPVPAMTPEQLDALAASKGVFPEGSAALPGANLTAAPAPTAAAPAGGPPRKPPVTIPSAPKEDKAGLGATSQYDDYMSTLKKDRADTLAELKGLSAKQREAALAAKSQGGGEALMGIARGILSKPGLAAGVSAGLPDVMAASTASRKEQNALNQSANDYDYNIAKYKEAAAKGDMEAALQYKKLAQDAEHYNNTFKYQMASLNKPDSGIAMLNALKDPANMAIYQKMYASRNPTDVMDREKAATLWEKLSRNEKRTKYGDDFETYYTSMNNRLLSATIPGQGANVIGTLK